MNADQEASLSEAVSFYLDAKNEGRVKVFVGFTHPDVVVYYKNQGDSIFTEKFDLSFDGESYSYLHDGQIKEIETKDEFIHVKYNFVSVDDYYYEVDQMEVHIYAISEDHGNSWFFMEEIDYLNDDIMKSKHRLIK